ncbi:MAG: hypothetical protein KKH40_01370 [Nanoarchaeota archaeon]|nr:hypothetical protein [Nanoarchaeota archaeon]
MREQIIRPLEEELASWIKGFYFPKEGVYTNSVNTNIIIPTKKEKSVIQEDLMLKLAQAINERSIMNFEKIPAGIDLRIANEYSSAFFGYTTKNKENQPKTFISIKPMLHEFLEQIYTQIKKQIPYEKITYRTNKKELITNQPYKEDCEKIIWKTNN